MLFPAFQEDKEVDQIFLVQCLSLVAVEQLSCMPLIKQLMALMCP